MTHATVATEVHEALDVHGNLTAEISFDGQLRHLCAERTDLGLSEVLGLGGRRHTGGRANDPRRRTANAEDVRQTNYDVLIHRDINPGDACHVCSGCLMPREKRGSILKNTYNFNALAAINPGAACGERRSR
jgi:hypothetical protein